MQTWIFGIHCFLLAFVCAVSSAVGDELTSRVRGGPSEAAPAGSKPFDWPRWRGIDFDGISPEKDWSSDWPETGPPVLWKANIGIGFGSFSIVDGRLYTMGSVEDSISTNELPKDAAEPSADEAAGAVGKPRKDVIWCLDANTGKDIWKLDYPAKLIDFLHEGGPAATPTIHDGLGYTVSKEGHFVCFDAATGEPRWTKEFVSELGVEMPVWGFSGSALIFENLVIVEAGRTAAFDRITGDLVWQTEKFRPGYSSPVSFPDHQSDKPLMASLNNDVLLILRPKDGKEVARSPFTTAHPTTACTPIIQDDSIFLSSGYNRGCRLLRLDGEELHEVYDNRNMRNHMNSCVYHDGYLYGFDGNSHSRRTAMIKYIDYSSGEIMWKERGYGVGSLLRAGNRIIALSDQGDLLVLKASSGKFELLASAQVIDGKCWTPPVLLNGRLYVRNATGSLICLDLRS